MSVVDYDFIEEVFKRILLNIESISQSRCFYNKLNTLAEKVTGFKVFIVLGGSYQERMMTTRSDLDFWAMLYGEEAFSIQRYKMNRLFREAIVEPAFKEIRAKYPHCHPCGSSVRVFDEFTEKNFKKPRYRWSKRISAGLKIITYGKVVDIDKQPFGKKAEYVKLRRKFKEFWKRNGIDIWDVWEDLSERLNKSIRNLKRRKGKSLYRILQLAVQQVSDAYGFPEKTAESLSLEQKIFAWTGRPKFARYHLKDLCKIIEKMRTEDLRGSQLNVNEFNKLKTQLYFFLENMYGPFRKFIKPLASILNIFEVSGIGIRYFGIAKTHGYVVFSQMTNPFTPIKGVDIELSDAEIHILANLGKVRKTIGTILKQHGYTILHEERIPEGEIIHKLGFDGRTRTHVLVGHYDKDIMQNENEHLRLDLMERLDALKILLNSPEII